MAKWTIIGYYVNNNQPWTEHVEAMTPAAAVLVATTGGKHGADLIDKVAVVDVIAGHHDSALYNSSILFKDALRLLQEQTEPRAITERSKDNALNLILSHAGSAIECCDKPGADCLREICEIINNMYGINTRARRSSNG